MALSFHPTTAPVFGHGLPSPDAADMTANFLHSEVSDALFSSVYDPLDDPSCNAAINELLRIPNSAAAFLGPVNKDDAKIEQHCDQSQQWYGGAGSRQVPEFLLPLPPLPQQPLAFVRGADGKGCDQPVKSAAARERWKRIIQKTAELSRLVPGGHKLSTAEMLQEAARHVKLLQAQVGMLALTRSVVGLSEMPVIAAQEELHALLVSGRVQERLAAEGKCLVPRKLVEAMARDKAVTSSPLVNRDLGRFIASLKQ